LRQVSDARAGADGHAAVESAAARQDLMME
jgi:hypothetical protein